MSAAVKHGGPAFPTQRQWVNDGDMNATAPDGQVYPPGAFATITEDGMALRDYFAAKAMQAIVSKYPASELEESAARAEMADFAFSAYAIADAMLKERDK